MTCPDSYGYSELVKSKSVALLLALGCISTSTARPGTQSQQVQQSQQVPDKTNRKQQKKQERALRKELASAYKKLLDEDLVYIITVEERAAFLRLGTDEEREQFIEQFWLRRNPNPDTVENEFKEEHYRRIAYANEHFSVGQPGWMSDRGRIYIIWGPPDHIDSNPTGGLYSESPGEGTHTAVTYPFEQWHFRYLEGIGNNITLEFVDKNSIGDYRLTVDPTEKEIFTSPGPLTRGSEPLLSGEDVNSRFRLLNNLNLYGKVQRAPAVRFKDLEEVVESRIVRDSIPVELRTSFFRVTDETLLVPLTVAIRKKNLSFLEKDQVQQAVLNVFCRIETITGRIVQTFEDVVQLAIPESLFTSSLGEPVLYQKTVPLRSGLYKLSLVVKDVNSGDIGVVQQRLAVPRFDADQLAHSSLILADTIEHVPVRNIGTGQFVIGDFKVRPVVTKEFHSNQTLGIYMQVYNLALNEANHKPDASVHYSIVRGTETILSQTETTATLSSVGSQLTLAKRFPLDRLGPGRYLLVVSVTDSKLNQTVQASANFRVLP